MTMHILNKLIETFDLEKGCGLCMAKTAKKNIKQINLFHNRLHFLQSRLRETANRNCRLHKNSLILNRFSLHGSEKQFYICS